MKTSEELLTEEAKIAKIKELLPAHERRGQFFVPDAAFYEPPLDNAGLNTMAKQLCVWLGFKPVGLTIGFSSEISSDSYFAVNEDGPAISINKRLANDAFGSGSLLAENLLQYYFQYRKHFVLSDTHEEQIFIMLAVTYAGLGLVAINRTVSRWQQLYPRLYLRINKSSLEVQHQLQYAAFVNRYAEEYRIELPPFMKYLCPWGQLLLPGIAKSTEPAAYAKLARQRSVQAYAALTASLLVVVSGVGLSIFVISQQPTKLTLAQRQAREEIDILKNSYELCNNSVTRQQKAFSAPPDFFLTQTFDAERVRCASIRNTYNYRSSQYNASLSPQK